MNYEERYNKALERAKLSRQQLLDIGEEAPEIEYIFPELKESKDEKIRKELLESFKYQQRESRTDAEWLNGIKLSEVVAWLEKQANIPHFTYDDILAIQCAMKTAEKADNGLYEQLKSLHDRLHDAYWLEKQGEQKSLDYEDANIMQKDFTPKVEPKFKIGDWIVSARGTAHIIDIGVNDSEFLLEYTDGDQESLNIEYVNSAYTKWTIQNAWEGDVLVCGDDKRPFIFKGLLDQIHPNCPVAYCGIDSGHNFMANCGDSWWTYKTVKPATKEQQQYLFKKMGEAGYMWDGHTKKVICK